ncbi:hypothetical protein F5Y19DRAFT_475365 [Xylariaceae sp. FL1651]|nr:hypothetical protein F5Y19DRAFT_475365 [Xylariaceae sp. FL1651]
MGSLDPQESELAVLVTGFGPFKKQYPVNPACEIAALLPDYLPAGHRSSRALPPVRIVKLAEPVRTSYEYVRDLVPKLWDDTDCKIDYAVHIGMAGPQLVYSLEQRGHRDGYIEKDVDGKLLEDEKRHAEQGDQWIWHGVPHELLSDFDIVDIHRRSGTETNPIVTAGYNPDPVSSHSTFGSTLN